MENNWQTLNEKVQIIDKDVKELKTSFDTLNEKVGEIWTALVGNKINPNGYGKKIEEIDERVKILENEKRENKWANTIFKIASGAIVGGLAVRLLENFIK